MVNQTKCADSLCAAGAEANKCIHFRLVNAKLRCRQVADKNEVSLFEASKWRCYLELWAVSLGQVDR